MTAIVHETRNERHNSRVELTGSLHLAGIDDIFELKDLSLSGCRIAGAVSRLDAGGHHFATVVLPFEDFDLKISGRVQVVRIFAGNDEAGLQFTDTDDRRSALIREVSLRKIRGEFTELDGLLAPAASQQKQSEPEPLAPSWGRYLRYASLLALGAVLISTVLFSLYSAFFTVRAEFASVSVPITRLAAPQTGTVASVMAMPGVRVGKGEPLFRIENMELENERSLLLAERDVLDARWETLRGELGGSRRTLASYSRSTENAVGQLEAEVAQLRLRRMAIGNILDRRKALEVNAFASATEVDTLRIERSVVEAEMLQREEALFRAERNLELVGEGLKPITNNLNARFPDEVEREIVTLRAQRNAIDSRLASLNKQLARLQVASPCDCVVTALLNNENESVAANAPVMEVRADTSRPVIVEMAVRQEDIGLIRIGDTAEVRLADRAESLTGTVVELARVRPADGRRGVPREVYDRTAGATIFVQLPISDALQPGLPAQASVRADLSAVSMDVFGLDLFALDFPEW